MWIDILLAIVALAGVSYSLAGSPHKKGKLTTAGKGLLATAILALLLSIVKSIGDESERNEKKAAFDLVSQKLAQSKVNTDRIPNLVKKIELLQENTDSVLQASAQANAETARLRTTILAIFENIRVENSQLIVTIPDSILVKDRGRFGQSVTKRVLFNKTRVVKEVQKFQNEMDKLENELLSKVERIETLFKTLSESHKTD